MFFFQFGQFGRKAKPVIAAGQNQIASGYIQICRYGRCFCLDTFPCHLYQQFVSLYQFFGRDLFDKNRFRCFFHGIITGKSRLDLNKSRPDVWDHFLYPSYINITKNGFLLYLSTADFH